MESMRGENNEEPARTNRAASIPAANSAFDVKGFQASIILSNCEKKSYKEGNRGTVKNM